MKRKAFKKFLISHIMVAAFVLAASLPFAFIYVRNAYNRETSAAYTDLSTTVANLSYEFSAVDDLVSSLHDFSKIRSVIAMREPLGKTDYYEALQAHSIWCTSAHNLKLLRNHYTFFTKNQIVFTPSRLFFSWSGFYGYWIRVGQANYEQWSADLSAAMSSARRRFYPACSVYTYDEGEFEAIVYDIPLTDAFNSGMVRFFINTDDILAALQLNADEAGSFLCLYDKNGQLIYNHGAPKEELNAVNGMLEKTIDGKRYCLFGAADSKTGLKYLVGAAAERFSQSYRNEYFQLLAYLSAVFLMASLLSSLLAMKQYKPIRRLYALFGALDSAQEDAPADEYLYFESAYAMLLEKNQNFRQTVANYEAALTTRAVEDLIRGGFTPDKKPEDAQLRIRLPEKWHGGLSMIEPRSGCEYADAYCGELNINAVEALRSAEAQFSLLHPLSDSMLFFVFPAEEFDSAFRVLNEISERFRSDHGAELYFSLSDACTELQQLSNAYGECKGIMACRSLYDKYVLRRADIKNQKEAPTFTLNNAGRLNGYMLCGESDRALELISSFLQNRYLPPQDFEQLFYSIRGVLLQAARGAQLAGICANVPFYRPELSHEQNADELITSANAICALYSAYKKAAVKNLSARIIDYLKREYASPDIYGKSVADRFSINEKYLYTIFKEQTGVNFAAYLEELRLSRARELLSESPLSVNEVAQQVGFTSPNTFYKAFRRVTGVSPSAYKQSQRPTGA